MDKSWFRKLRCGAFLHWGLYAIPGGVWKGREVDYIGEWIQALLRLPNEEYSQLAREFNPVDFDADKLVSASPGRVLAIWSSPPSTTTDFASLRPNTPTTTA